MSQPISPKLDYLMTKCVKMNIFLAYRYSGEDIGMLNPIIKKIKNTLETKGREVFCSLFYDDHFKKNFYSQEEIYLFCLKKLLEHETILFFIKSNHPSKGMDLELEEAIKDKKKIILAIQNNLNFKKYRDSAHQIIEYNSFPELYKHLSHI